MGLLQLFSNPAMLGGLALAAAPLIIHLLNKRRFEVHEWAAMDFLFQASIMNRRRVRFEDLLILLLRILLIALLVFAVARPLLKGLGSWDEDRRLVLGHNILRQWSLQCYTIGIVRRQVLTIVSNRFKNVPDQIIHSFRLMTPRYIGVEQFYLHQE